MARMMSKSNRASLMSDAALLLPVGIALLVRYVSQPRWLLIMRGPLTPGDWEPIKQAAVHLEDDRQDRGPHHARPHPQEGAASHRCSAHGVAAVSTAELR